MPLIESKPDAVAITYARALFDVVKGGGQEAVERTFAELEAVLEEARQSKSFSEFLSSRIVDSDRRSLSIEKIFGGKFSQPVVNFLKVLNDKGRLHALPAVTEAFDSVAQQSFGRVEVDITTAVELSQGEKDALAARLQQKLGKAPVLHCTVNPALIGGMRIQIGDQLIDSSVSTRLGQIREAMNTRGSSIVRAAADRIISSQSNGVMH